MIIVLHQKVNGYKVAIDIRNISYFAENFTKNEDGTFSDNEGTAIFVVGNDPFLVKESFDQVKELMELASNKKKSN